MVTPPKAICHPGDHCGAGDVPPVHQMSMWDIGFCVGVGYDGRLSRAAVEPFVGCGYMSVSLRVDDVIELVGRTQIVALLPRAAMASGTAACAIAHAHSLRGVDVHMSAPLTRYIASASALRGGVHPDDVDVASTRCRAGGVHVPSSTAGRGLYSRSVTPSGPSGAGSQFDVSSAAGGSFCR